MNDDGILVAWLAISFVAFAALEHYYIGWYAIPGWVAFNIAALIISCHVDTEQEQDDSSQ